MKTWITAIACTAMLGLAACDDMTSQQRTVTGATGGAAAGLLTATALGGDSKWRLIGGLAGAAAGTMVATNKQRTVCAYSRGDGTYYEAPCP